MAELDERMEIALRTMTMFNQLCARLEVTGWSPEGASNVAVWNDAQTQLALFPISAIPLLHFAAEHLLEHLRPSERWFALRRLALKFEEGTAEQTSWQQALAQVTIQAAASSYEGGMTK